MFVVFVSNKMEEKLKKKSFSYNIIKRIIIITDNIRKMKKGIMIKMMVKLTLMQIGRSK